MNRGRAARASRLVIAIAVAAASVIVVLAPEAMARGKTPVRTAPGKILIVSANVFETDYSDVADTSDLRVFVKRMFRQVPRSPDVVLLQEVWGRSASAVAALMSKASPDRYAVVISAADPPWRQPSPTHVVGTDSAIIINTRTMTSARGGYIRLGYDESKAAPKREVRVKRHPYALVKERRGKFALPVVSVHFPKAENFASRKISGNVKARWIRTINKRLGRYFSSESHRKRRVIAGDLNNPRCQRGAPLCRLTPAYRAATKKLRYRDSVNALNGWDNPIDFIFSKANVSRAEVDPATKKQQRRYSDHLFRWALLEKRDRTPPTPPRKVGYGKGTHDAVKIRGWDKARDGGAGFARFKIQRSAKGRNKGFHTVGRSRDTRFRDVYVQAGRKYWYRVVAWDRAGNRSRFSAPFRVRAGEPLPNNSGGLGAGDKRPLPRLPLPRRPQVDLPTIDGPDAGGVPKPKPEVPDVESPKDPTVDPPPIPPPSSRF